MHRSAINSLKTILLCPKDSTGYAEDYQFLQTLGRPQLIETLESIKAGFISAKQSSDELLSNLPNLFFHMDMSNEAACSAYQQIEKFFLGSEQGILDETCDAKLIQYLSDRLQEPLTVQVLTFIISLMLQSFYGERGNQLVRTLQDSVNTKIKNVLCLNKMSNELHEFPSSLTQPILALRRLLKSLDRQERLVARGICETYRVPLSTGVMMNLSMDGLYQEGSAFTERPFKGVLVVGETGSGKSTTINYLTGVKYQANVSPKTRLPYLEYLPPVLPKARVGHGYISRTLYSQIIGNLIDTPGLNDTRLAEEGACASVGPALAVNLAKGIAGIMVTIPWDVTATSSGGRGAIFKNICSSLSNMVPDVDALMTEVAADDNLIDEKPCRLMFVFTNPNVMVLTPGEDYEAFRMVLRNRVKEIMKDNAGRFENGLRVMIDKEAELDASLKSISACLKYLSSIYESISEKRSTVQNFVVTPLISLMSNFSDVRNSDVKNGVNRRRIEEAVTGLLGKDNNILTDDVTRMIEAIFHIMMSERSERKEVFDNTVNNWEKQHKELSQQLQELRGCIAEVESEKKIFSWLLMRQDNTFFITGYDPMMRTGVIGSDHKEALLEYIGKLTESNAVIPPDKFSFDAAQEKYIKIIYWLEEQSSLYSQSIKSFFRSYEKALALDQQISDQQKKIDDGMSAFSVVYSTGDDAESIKRKIEDLEALNQNHQQEINKKIAENQQLAEEIVRLQAKITDIKAMPLQDFNSSIRHEPIQWWSLFNRWQYHYPERFIQKPASLFGATIFDFVGYRERAAVPIEQVVLSSVINEKSELVFDRPLADCSQPVHFLPEVLSTSVCDATNRIVSNVRQIKTVGELKSTGDFVISQDCNLEKGIFSVTYKPNSWSTMAGIRVMVKAENVPELRLDIVKYQSEIARREKVRGINQTTIDGRNTAIADNTVELELINKGLLLQAKKHTLLMKRWNDLGKPVERYLDGLFKDLTEEMRQWLCKDENVELLLNLRLEGEDSFLLNKEWSQARKGRLDSFFEKEVKKPFPTLSISAYSLIIGSENILSTSSHEAGSHGGPGEEQHAEAPEGLFAVLYDLTIQTGLCAQTIIAILKRLKRPEIYPSDSYTLLSKKLREFNYCKYFYETLEASNILQLRDMHAVYRVQSVFTNMAGKTSIVEFKELYEKWMDFQENAAKGMNQFFGEVLPRHAIEAHIGETFFKARAIIRELRGKEGAEFASELQVKQAELRHGIYGKAFHHSMLTELDDNPAAETLKEKFVLLPGGGLLDAIILSYLLPVCGNMSEFSVRYDRIPSLEGTSDSRLRDRDCMTLLSYDPLSVEVADFLRRARNSFTTKIMELKNMALPKGNNGLAVNNYQASDQELNEYMSLLQQQIRILSGNSCLEEIDGRVLYIYQVQNVDYSAMIERSYFTKADQAAADITNNVKTESQRKAGDLEPSMRQLSMFSSSETSVVSLETETITQEPAELAVSGLKA